MTNILLGLVVFGVVGIVGMLIDLWLLITEAQKQTAELVKQTAYLASINAGGQARLEVAQATKANAEKPIPWHGPNGPVK